MPSDCCPIRLAALSLITTLLNLWLAGRITLASGRLTRPWPDLASFTLPSGATLALLAAIALSFAGGVPGHVGSGFAGAFTMAFAMLGTSRRSRPDARIAVADLHAVGALCGAADLHTGRRTLLLALAGLAETIFHYRAAKGSAPTNTNT